MIGKAQEEAVGFVAIVVIVALVLVFFIGITLRDKPQEVGSVSVRQFLESSSQVTSECDMGLREKYLNLQALLESCHVNPMATCLDGTPACEVYKKTMQQLLETSWPIREGGAIKGYVLNTTYETNSLSEEVISFQNGSCEGRFMAEETLSPDALAGGTFITSLKICM